MVNLRHITGKPWQPKQAAGGRRMTGAEAVTAVLATPDGHVSALPIALAEGGGHFQATLHWLQLGVHKVG